MMSAVPVRTFTEAVARISSRFTSVLSSALLFSTLLPGVLLFGGPVSAHAQGSPIALMPTPLRVDDLPFPGEEVKLVVKLSGTKDTDLRLKVLAVIDGQLTDVSASKAYLNEYDRPVYELKIHSPVAQLAYQFVLYNPDGSVAISPRYEVRRTCVPQVSLTDVQTDAIKDPMGKLQKLVEQAVRLDSELKSYETSVNLLEQLEKRLTE